MKQHTSVPVQIRAKFGRVETQSAFLAMRLCAALSVRKAAISRFDAASYRKFAEAAYLILILVFLLFAGPSPALPMAFGPLEEQPTKIQDGDDCDRRASCGGTWTIGCGAQVVAVDATSGAVVGATIAGGVVRLQVPPN